tara:strand:- start:1017 stop:2783 length:1767 start_codon:yes stop_codon:yes gene_type:complete
MITARKYRPNKFSEVFGQDSITKVLEKSISNQMLSQAYLFCGPRGVGKTTCARIFAKEINNHNSDTENQDFTYNIFELDAASNNSVEDIRSLTDQVRIPPQNGTFKVYIIDEVHMLSQSAFNAFLKTLEEPPPHAKFILATTEKHKIIPTILSRCQTFDFKRITIQSIVEKLVEISKIEQITYENEALRTIAKKSDGSMRDAMFMFDQLATVTDKNLSIVQVNSHLNVIDVNFFFEMVDFMKNYQIDSLIKRFDHIIDSGYELRQFILSFAQHFRDLLMSKDTNNENFIDYSSDIIGKYTDQSKNMSYKTLVECLDECNKADIDYNISSNKKILIELSLYKINQLISSESDNKPTQVGKNIEKEETLNEKITENQRTLDPVVSHVNKTDSSDQPKSRTFSINTLSEKEETLNEKITQNERTLNPVVSSVNKTDSSDQPKSRTLSINALSEKEDNKIQHNNFSSKEESLSQEILQSKWSEFIKKLKEDKDTNLMIALSNFTPKLKDNHSIEVYVSNTSQKEIAISRLNYIKTYLSKELNNDNIQIKFEVTELDEKDKKPYTNSEKFKEMVNQNPNLEDLRSKFDLDYDY